MAKRHPTQERKQRPSSDKRRFPRRAKSIRFRFEHDGEMHFGVTTSVSLSGAFLKAAHVPKNGTVLVLEERFNPDGVAIAVRGEVVWGIEAPTLERPDTGFGFRFIELFTKADPGLLEDFLRALDPVFHATGGGEIAYEERSTGVHAVYRFPPAEVSPATFVHANHGFDDAHVIDLAGELERLSREEAREARDLGLAWHDGAGAGSPETGGAPGSGPSTGGRPPGPPETRPRSRKRSVTGIFTALFGRGARDDQPLTSEPTPLVAGDNGLLVHDARRPRLLVSWGQQSVVGRIESLARLSATLWTNDGAPAVGDAVVLRPVGTPPGLQQLQIHGVVTSRDDREQGGLAWLSIEFSRIDEQGRAGRFQDYLKLVNGPGADER